MMRGLLLRLAFVVWLLQAVTAQAPAPPCVGTSCAPVAHHIYEADLKHDPERVLADADIVGHQVQDPHDDRVVVEAEAVEQLCIKKYATQHGVSESSESAKRACHHSESSKSHNETNSECRARYAKSHGVDAASVAAHRACWAVGTAEHSHASSQSTPSPTFSKLFKSESSHNHSRNHSESSEHGHKSTLLPSSHSSHHSSHQSSTLFDALFHSGSSAHHEHSESRHDSHAHDTHSQSKHSQEHGHSNHSHEHGHGHHESGHHESGHGEKSAGSLETRIKSLEARLLEEQKKSANLRAKLLLSDSEASKHHSEHPHESSASSVAKSLLHSLSSESSHHHTLSASEAARVNELKGRIEAMLRDLDTAHSHHDDKKASELTTELQHMTHATSEIRDAIKDRITHKQAEIDADKTLSEASKAAAKKAVEHAEVDELNHLLVHEQSSGHSSVSTTSLLKDLKSLARSEASIAQSLKDLKAAGFHSESGAAAKRAQETQLAISREVSEISQGLSEIRRLENDLARTQRQDDKNLGAAIREVEKLKTKASDVSLSLKTHQDMISSQVNSVKRREDRVDNVVRELNDRVKALEQVMEYLPGAKPPHKSTAHSEISVSEHGHGHSEHGHGSHGHSEHGHSSHSEHGHSSHSEHGHSSHGHSEHGHSEHGHSSHGHSEHGHTHSGEHGHSHAGHSSHHAEHGHASSHGHNSGHGHHKHWVKKWIKKHTGPHSSQSVSQEISVEESEESSEESSEQNSAITAIGRVKAFFNKVLAKKHKFF